MKFIHSIHFKIYLGVLVTLLVLIGGLVLSVQWSFERSFLHYVNTAEERFQVQFIQELGDLYASENSWEPLRNNWQLWHRLKLITISKTFVEDDSSPSPRFMPMPRPDREWNEIPDTEESGHAPSRNNWPYPNQRQEARLAKNLPARPAVALLDSNHQVIVGHFQITADIEYKPIKVNNETVGYLAVRPLRRIANRHDIAFIRQLGESFYIIVIVMAGLSLLLSVFLVHPMIRRIQTLKNATHELTAGNFNISLPNHSRDELGLLANDFSQLARSLEKNEKVRQEWIADISHELRTPISILRGEIEALQDGVRQQTPETLERLHTEIMNLERLVHDLYELSMSDIGALNYQKETCNPAKILQQTVAVFSNEFADKNISVSVNSEISDTSTIFADPDRMTQLFSNLLTNSLRYTDSGGQLDIVLRKQENNLLLLFDDSAPGVAEQDLPKLFDRLFRLEHSRNRSSGGAGLGLAICKNIVEAHDGQISASHSSMGGLEIKIILPLAS